MPRSIYQIKGITLIIHLNSMAFNGYTTLFLQIHIVQYLVLHLPNVHRSGELQHTIRQCTFSVIYVCNNAKISYSIHNLLQNYNFFLICAKKVVSLHKFF